MKNKYTFWSFKPYEYNAFAEYLEGMAKKGWFLKSLGAGDAVQHFEKEKPRSCRCSVALVPGSSETDDEDSEEKKRYRELCEEAGWHFRCEGSVAQVFYTERKDVLPVETDDALSVNTTKGIMTAPYRVVGCVCEAVLYLSILIQRFAAPVDALSAGGNILNTFVISVCAAIWLGGLAANGIWLRKADQALRQGIPVPSVSLVWVKKKTYLWWFSEIGLVVAIFIDSAGIILLFAAGLLGCCLLCRRIFYMLRGSGVHTAG